VPDEAGILARSPQGFEGASMQIQELEQWAATQGAVIAWVHEETRQRLTEAVETRICSVVESVAGAASAMHATAVSMTHIIDTAREQAAAISAASTQAGTNVETVAAAAEELSTSVAEFARRVAHSSSRARDAIVAASRSSDIVDGLADAAEHVGEVAGLIRTIAAQTDLLALNATIEAARDGEAGREYPVVAANVKILATRTTRATEEIRNQIDGVQKATGDVIHAMTGIVATIGLIGEISGGIAIAGEQPRAPTHETTGAVRGKRDDSVADYRNG
jgi:methyl-accepting chemotaxis protein